MRSAFPGRIPPGRHGRGMHEYDVLVIGGGAANKVASAASGAGLETALTRSAFRDVAA